MTHKEFIVWLRGFVAACNQYAPTPAQWSEIRQQLSKINDATSSLNWNGNENSTITGITKQVLHD